MSKKERENKEVERYAAIYRSFPDEMLLRYYNALSPGCLLAIKKAYKIVLRERGLK